MDQDIRGNGRSLICYAGSATEASVRSKPIGKEPYLNYSASLIDLNSSIFPTIVLLKLLYCFIEQDI